MLWAGGLQLLGWVGVSMLGVGWVQEMGVGEFAIKVVLSDRGGICISVQTLCSRKPRALDQEKNFLVNTVI